MVYYASYYEVILSFFLCDCDAALLPVEAKVSTHRRSYGAETLREGVERAFDTV